MYKPATSPASSAFCANDKSAFPFRKSALGFSRCGRRTLSLALFAIQQLANCTTPRRIQLAIDVITDLSFGFFTLLRLAARRAPIGKPGLIWSQLKLLAANDTSLDRKSHVHSSSCGLCRVKIFGTGTDRKCSSVFCRKTQRKSPRRFKFFGRVLFLNFLRRRPQ